MHDPERDWNAVSDDEFRRIIRSDFEQNYPEALRFPARRMRWAEVRQWYLRMAGKGWIAPGWPREHGGMGLSAAKLLIFVEEQERHGVARFPDQGITMVGPILMRFGTSEQKQRFLGPILRCDHIWCQGYSEPNAGSDLASLTTSAVPVEDGFVINGQKIWTTLAQDASHIYVLARTDRSGKKQSGISFFLVPMDSPGVTVRPIRDVAGHEEFNEVFFDNVRVPHGNLVGAINEGWAIAKSLLGFERIFVGSTKLPEYGLQVLAKAAAAVGAAQDPQYISKYASLKLDVAHLGLLYKRHARLLTQGIALGPEVSALKILATETFQRIAELAIETAGPNGVIRGGIKTDEGTIDVPGAFFMSRTTTIYGGTNEVQRNIIAKQVLRLPQS